MVGHSDLNGLSQHKRFCDSVSTWGVCEARSQAITLFAILYNCTVPLTLPGHVICARRLNISGKPQTYGILFSASTRFEKQDRAGRWHSYRLVSPTDIVFQPQSCRSNDKDNISYTIQLVHFWQWTSSAQMDRFLSCKHIWEKKHIFQAARKYIFSGDIEY